MEFEAQLSEFIRGTFAHKLAFVHDSINIMADQA